MAYPGSAVAPAPSLSTLAAKPLKRAIAARVVALFNDGAQGERPVPRSAEGIFPPGSVIRRVHGDVTSMMVGGVASLMLQMLHPGVLAGVWDHSRFRTDLHGRLRRTARFIALTTYGAREEAEAAIARVRRIHGHVTGTLPDGTPYAANDPALLAWVHVTEATSFLAAYIRYAEPRMTAADRDRYLAEIAEIGQALGADPVPRTVAQAREVMAAMRPQMRTDDRTREVGRFLLSRRAEGAAMDRLQSLTNGAAIDLLPDWARRLHALPDPVLTRPLLRAGTRGIARTLRWAFA